MRLLFSAILLLISGLCKSREGMWMPQLLKELNESDMKSMGMQISAEDIYSINHSSIKDAVLQFGGGCTGELVSAKGLLITNHHCGFSQIQSLSTIEKNYLKDGFWSTSEAEEIPCPGLTVTFIREITDVTQQVLFGVSDTMSEDSRAAIIKLNSDSIEKTITGTMKGTVRSFYFGNKFYLFRTETFKDIRFVGAPPQSIGKFGGETDNWMWPRHTGDFSLFRIYADKENNPASYSKENVSYTAKQFMTINISGVKEDDFVFVFGFPGRTNEYIPASSLEMIEKQTNPNRITLRETRLDIMRVAMRNNDTVKLQYSAKFATLENAYKKWQGELIGFRKFDAVNKKRIMEKNFITGLDGLPGMGADAGLLSRFDSLNAKAKPLNYANDFFAEGFPGIELLNATMRLKALYAISTDKNEDDKKVDEERKKAINDFRSFYKNHNRQLDMKICAAIFSLAENKLDKKYVSELVEADKNRLDGLRAYTEELYANSLVADSTRLMKFLSDYKRKDAKKIKSDPAYILALDISDIQQKLQAELARLNKDQNSLQRKYMKRLLELDKNRKLFPDGNSTLRVSYGRVEGTHPRDGIDYDYYTTTDGILEKSATGERDYKIPDGFAELIKKNDFGRYAQDGMLHVAFLASTHTTGGNSGSPVLNAKGELVGINYDRMWEGVMSDYYYDEETSRNISVDIRYVLFVIEKFGKAERLIGEMRIVN